jgi:adenylate cyclase
VSHLRDLIRFEHARGFQLPRGLDRVVSAGIVSTDPKVVRRQMITNVAALASAFNSISRVIANSFYGSDDYLLAQLASGSLAIAALLLHRLHRFGDNVAAVGMVMVFIVSASLSTYLFGLQSQVQAYFVLAGLIWFLMGFEHWRFALGAIFAVAATAIALLQIAPEIGTAVSEGTAGLIAIQSLANAITINAVMLFYALYLVQRAEDELERESRRAEALVSVVLPGAVAARLRAEPDKRIADRLEGVSILFADLAGFTEAAHHESPEAVVAYLDDFVRAVDATCEAHGVEKIKTIGDAYMAASGLQGDRRAGAVAMGRLALAMMTEHASRPTLGKRRLSLRVGIHCGSAIAGVIGDTRISYDLWGDAVNMASRLETQGTPGRIHVSEAFRAAVGEAFRFEERGPTEIRGIGSVPTYFLVATAGG